MERYQEFRNLSTKEDEDVRAKIQPLIELYPQFFTPNSVQQQSDTENIIPRDQDAFITFRSNNPPKRKTKNKISMNLKLNTKVFVHAQSISLQYPFSFSKKSFFESLTSRHWYYLDSDYVIQGPYSALEMDTWHRKRFFDSEMMLTYRSLEINAFQKLKELYQDRFEFSDQIKAKKYRHHSVDHIKIKKKPETKVRKQKNLPFISLNALNDFYKVNAHKQMMSYEFLSFSLQSPYMNGSV